MKLAAARAGLWFFGTIIFILLFMSDMLKGKSSAEVVGALAFFATIVGGVVFFWTWHQVVEEDRKLEIAERHKALQRGSADKTP